LDEDKKGEIAPNIKGKKNQRLESEGVKKGKYHPPTEVSVAEW